jgi:hypothetical protein
MNHCVRRVIGALLFVCVCLAHAQMSRLDEMLRLSDRWVQHVQAQGETGMGYHIVSVVLKDGRRFDQGVVVLPYLGGIRGYDKVPFREDEIEQIVVTHDRGLA